MCGRYVFALRYAQARRRLHEDYNLQVDDAPPDDNDDHGGGGSRDSGSRRKQPAVRRTHNVAPGYYEPIYRAVPSSGADSVPSFVIQPMKWGLVPSWTKKSQDYSSLMKTINCRDDALSVNKGLWNSIKHRKRCVVIAEGFFEWLKKGNDKLPHYVKRKDGKLMCFAGLWDHVRPGDGEDGDGLWTYTIITTSSNKQLKFLHDRMPVILETEEVKKWLDLETTQWNGELQALLKPWDGELEVYQVPKDVGKVGNDSPSFVVPLEQSKGNIKNFFGKRKVKQEQGGKVEAKDSEEDFQQHTGEAQWEGGKGDAEQPLKMPLKRELGEERAEGPSKKTIKKEEGDVKRQSPRKMHSATSNIANRTTPKKKATAPSGNKKITNFFNK